VTPRILTVHAHPDDEASKGAATIAKYRAGGAEAMLVCCTGGEAGDILNPAVDNEETRANLPAVRRAELEAAGNVIGYNKIEMLGYRDSGMPDSEENAHPDAFANAPLDEAVERLVTLIRSFRPQVIVTYSDDQQGYQHPDHIRVNDISVPAFDLSGDASQFLDVWSTLWPLWNGEL
jgi:mycothiol S-conjugate amidase